MNANDLRHVRALAKRREAVRADVEATVVRLSSVSTRELAAELGVSREFVRRIRARQAGRQAPA